MELQNKLISVCEAFQIQGKYLSYEEIKMGNVNKTYRVNYLMPDGTEKGYMLQKVNTYVFKRPELVMENIERVTSHLRTKQSRRTSLNFYHTLEGKNYLLDESGFWRACNYIPSVTFNTCDDLEVVRNGGDAFGEFQMLLADCDATALHETIPDFHNTKKRYEKLMEDIKADPCGKVQEVKEEIEWLMQVKDKACALTQLYEDGKLPLRVTHNDTKINNVLFDAQTRDAVAVIDLDTVMPGLVGHDFGDAIRFAANLVEEDCPEYEKAGLNMQVFEVFADGFLRHTANALTQAEIETLALSAFVLTAELVVRFLNDYILGSPYFKINYPEHNLVRTRCQMALAKDMLKKENEMQAAVLACAEKYRK